MIRLQHCLDCGAAQYPPRSACGICLSPSLDWLTAEYLPASVLSRTTLHHSNEPAFRNRLPLTIGLVQFAQGPVAVCFVPADAQPGDSVAVRLNGDCLLEAS